MNSLLQSLFAQACGTYLATKVSKVYVQEFRQVHVVFYYQYFFHKWLIGFNRLAFFLQRWREKDEPFVTYPTLGADSLSYFWVY
jgi:hypothetical protein